jgi:hypothetical protein
MFQTYSHRPKIKFTCSDLVKDVIPNPTPAHKAMPEWFKRLDKDVSGLEKTEAGTAKRCVPVLEAISQGYIIPLWADLYVKVFMQDGDTHPTIKCSFPNELNLGLVDNISSHGWDQVGDLCDLKKFSLGKVLIKLSNPWIIETPKGWSIQIKNPANNWSNDLQLIEGVVDSDTYYNQVNLPCVWTGSELGEWIIPKGTPLAQVIPFKRQRTSMKVETYDLDRVAKTQTKLGTLIKDKYRKLFWHKGKKS